MGDIVGRIFVIMFGITLLFFAPVTILAIKQDTSSQTYINNTVVEFVDTARATGQITPFEYESFTKKVYAAHAPMNVNIIHNARYVIPVYEAGVITGYKYSDETYSIDDILSKMYPESSGNEDYELKEGDYIKVVVYNESPTLGGRLMSVITPSYNPERTLFASYGGYVGNNMQTPVLE